VTLAATSGGIAKLKLPSSFTLMSHHKSPSFYYFKNSSGETFTAGVLNAGSPSEAGIWQGISQVNSRRPHAISHLFKVGKSLVQVVVDNNPQSFHQGAEDAQVFYKQAKCTVERQAKGGTSLILRYGSDFATLKSTQELCEFICRWFALNNL
jgi:hypothetical protein